MGVTLSNGWSNISKLSWKIMKPCLVIGSGFHSWVLGKSNTPLSNWNKLIDEVAESLSLATPSHTLNPVLRWEKLLENASNDGFKPSAPGSTWIEKQSLKISEIEPYAKNAVKDVLERFLHCYPNNSARSLFPISEYFGSVISLNFDHCWIGGTNFKYQPTGDKTKYEKLYQSEIDRLHNYITKDSHPLTKVWYPNGSLKSPGTIRMGLYDYGTKPYSIKEAFNNIKSFENQAYKEIGSDDWDLYEHLLEKAISENNSLVNNWVSDFLYRPIYFAGAGLSESETGLWWLLAQRARNFAKLGTRERPPTYVLTNAKDPRHEFWANRPCGVDTITCTNWDIGWEMIMDKVNPRAISGGTF